MWKPHPYIYSIWLSLEAFSSIAASKPYWQIDLLEATYAPSSLSVNITPALTPYAKWKGMSRNLLIADIEQNSKNPLFFHSLPSEFEIKKWSLRLYFMDAKQWIVWKEAFTSQDLFLLQTFEANETITVDCLLKNPEGDKLLRLWLRQKPAMLDYKEISHGSFIQAMTSPSLREGGSGRFLYTLDSLGNFQSFDTLRGYLKRQISVPGAENFEVKLLKEDPSQLIVEIYIQNKIQTYNGQTLQKQ
jgi:hypothetical protein